MLTLKEYTELTRVDEAWSTSFDDRAIEAAEYFTLTYNPYSLNTVVRLLDEYHKSLGEVEFEEAEMAGAFLEEVFDLDDETVEWIYSYTWANDGAEIVKVDEAVVDIETMIRRLADENKVRIEDVDMDDDQTSVKVYFHENNQMDNVRSFVRLAAGRIGEEYGVTTESFEDYVWVIQM